MNTKYRDVAASIPRDQFDPWIRPLIPEDPRHPYDLEVARLWLVEGLRDERIAMLVNRTVNEIRGSLERRYKMLQSFFRSEEFSHLQEQQLQNAANNVRQLAARFATEYVISAQSIIPTIELARLFARNKSKRALQRDCGHISDLRCTVLEVRTARLLEALIQDDIVTYRNCLESEPSDSNREGHALLKSVSAAYIRIGLPDEYLLIEECRNWPSTRARGGHPSTKQVDLYVPAARLVGECGENDTGKLGYLFGTRIAALLLCPHTDATRNLGQNAVIQRRSSAGELAQCFDLDRVPQSVSLYLFQPPHQTLTFADIPRPSAARRARQSPEHRRPSSPKAGGQLSTCPPQKILFSNVFGTHHSNRKRRSQAVSDT